MPALLPFLMQGNYGGGFGDFGNADSSGYGQMNAGMPDMQLLLSLANNISAKQQKRFGSPRQMQTASAGTEGDGNPRQLPTQPTSGGNPTYGMPAGWQQGQGVPAGWTSGQGGVMTDPAGNTYDAAGNPLTFTGITTPQMTMPTDRNALLQALARSTQPDRYGNTPYAGSTPGFARISSIPDFSKPPLPGNMVDPRNWDATMWINHPEWHNPEVDRAYDISQGTFNHRGPYTDPSGGSLLPFQKQPLPPASSWGFNPATGMWGYQGVPTPDLSQPGQYANDWTRLGFHNAADWQAAGSPTSLPQGTPLYTGVGGQYRAPATPTSGAPAGGSGQMGIGLPSVPPMTAWQQAQASGFAGTKPEWKQQGRPAGGGGDLNPYDPLPPQIPIGGRPSGSGQMGIGLPQIPNAPQWQRQNFADKAQWKQAGRPLENMLTQFGL